jgi:hypothetical protein
MATRKPKTPKTSAELKQQLEEAKKKIADCLTTITLAG